MYCSIMLYPKKTIHTNIMMAKYHCHVDSALVLGPRFKLPSLASLIALLVSRNQNFRLSPMDSRMTSKVTVEGGHSTAEHTVAPTDQTSGDIP
jgi:hypothetical protein